MNQTILIFLQFLLRATWLSELIDRHAVQVDRFFSFFDHRSLPGEYFANAAATTHSLDETKLENVKKRAGGGITARCPVCAETGHDKTGNHLVVFPNGSFACIQFPERDGIEHRQRILALVGDKPALLKRVSAYPALEEAIANQERKLKAKATRRDYYNQRFVVVRFDSREGEKEYRPFHLSNDGWIMRDLPGKLPLFNLEQVRERRTDHVYLVEGEKCVCELRDKTGLLATTSAHGAKSPHKTDWRPLAGREVVILPDAGDEGKDYAQKVANALLNLDSPAKIKIVALPDLPPKGDCVEWLQSRNGQSQQEIVRELEALVKTAPQETQLPKAALTDVGAMKNLADYNENDGGNAEIFVDRYGEIVRYIHFS